MLDLKQKEYDTVAKIVEKFIASEEEDKHLTAGLHKDLLSQAFLSLDSIAQQIALILPQVLTEISIFALVIIAPIHR